MKRIIAIDFGLRRVGLAVSDTLRISANPLDVLDPKDVISYLMNYKKNEDFDTIVIGYPLNFDQTSTHATKHVDAFILKLKQEFIDISIIKRDESYTSKNAVRTMVEMGIKKKDRKTKSNIDKISAVLILQEYLQIL